MVMMGSFGRNQSMFSIVLRLHHTWQGGQLSLSTWSTILGLQEEKEKYFQKITVGIFADGIKPVLL